MKKNLKIINESSPFFNQMGYIVSTLEYEKVEFFLLENESIVEISINDLSGNNKLFVPKSRKDFYEYINNQEISRNDIIDSSKALIDKNKILLKEITAEDFMNMIKNDELARIELVDLLRKSRDAGQFDFILPNNSNPRKKHYDKKK